MRRVKVTFGVIASDDFDADMLVRLFKDVANALAAMRVPGVVRAEVEELSPEAAAAWDNAEDYEAARKALLPESRPFTADTKMTVLAGEKPSPVRGTDGSMN